MSYMEKTKQQMISVEKDEFERLNKLVERLSEDKKEMEEEFKEILSSILADIESREQLGQLLSKNEVEDYKASGVSLEKLLTKQEEQQKQLEQRDRTINDLKNKLTRLQKSKLGKLQMKYWEFRNKKK